MKSSWFLVLPIALSILFSSVSSAAQEPDKKAMEQIYRDANLGDPKAQLYLGSMYGNGKGVPLDHAEAAKWYRKAAEQGYAKAQWYLGRAYYNGAGLPRDYAEAEKWYRKAADQGFAEAQNDLKKMLELGQLVHRDFAKADLDITEAEKLYRKAAEQGNTKAQDYLPRIKSAIKSDSEMSRHEKVARWLFPFILAFSGLAIWRGKRLRKRLLPPATTHAEATSQRQKTWTDKIGIIAKLVFFVIGLFLIINAEYSAGLSVFFLLFIAFLSRVEATLSRAEATSQRQKTWTDKYDSSPWRADLLQTLGFTGAAWLCYGLYEMQMLQAMEIQGGNPIRVDLLVVYPLLYFATKTTMRSWKALRAASKRES